MMMINRVLRQMEKLVSITEKKNGLQRSIESESVLFVDCFS